ncbi:MAG: tRNA uridine-5-carboxymethylaminomethyl(34) synthesis GTPase MnmE [Planktothrix sp.]|uniref:tRNA uridine-5-carboxymethylaminomethyl(34) synthesis GTPase MnmE n=2 Tax=Planktothrix sp. TaxID=3088171 RepID=UPI0038D3BA70
MGEVLATGETIVAIATAIVPQQGSVGIVRMSGTESQAIAKQLFYSPGRQTWESHRILYGYIRHPKTQKTIDEALLLLMLSPRSYTREDVVEFHCHGGIIAVQQVLQLCIELGARLAQPGEFTLRAFLNGRLDLTQAESVAELVGSQSIAAAQMALAGIQGKLANPIRELRATCLDILAEIEARVDFEEDLPPLNESEIIGQIHHVLEELSRFLATADTGELLRTGLKVAIVGRPNVGKSSLLNAWSRSDRAIVTNLPGTTRDVVESQLVVGGIPIQVLDTAGIRHSEDQVEKIGIERSRQAAQSADLVLLTLDATMGLTEADLEIYQQVKTNHFIVVINKIDQVNSQELEQLKITVIQCLNIENQAIVPMAAALNQGLPELENAILNAVQAGNVQASNLEFAINQRQAAALSRAKLCLEQVETTIRDQLPFDFWTIDLRGAIHALGEVTGEEVTESVLDRIFSRFCIGK